MAKEDKLMQQVMDLFEKRGQEAVEASRIYAMNDKTGYQPLDDAMKFFLQEIWFDFLHPSLVSLSCDAVGGRTEKTINIGAAIVLMAGGADIHDDIIDESVTKGLASTVFGKFGRDIAVLVGDLLLQKGLYMLHESCVDLPKEQAQEILKLVRQAFLDICSGEAQEASLRGRFDISKDEYLGIIRKKVSASEVSMRIGAILGGGSREDINKLGKFGQTFGILMTIRDDFIDMFEADELRNRFDKECLPLPILLTFKEDSRKKLVLQLLKGELSENTIEKILDAVMDSSETSSLLTDMNQWVQEELPAVSSFHTCFNTLRLLLQATLEDLM